jgi:DNA-binding transcriptional LysR family regulator
VAARQKKLCLKDLSQDPFILYPREVGPTLFDTVIAACRDAGFDPILGQSAPQLASVVHLVAAELGVSLVPASMQQVHAAGVVFKEINDVSPIARLTLAWRRSDNSIFLQNFINCAVS